MPRPPRRKPAPDETQLDLPAPPAATPKPRAPLKDPAELAKIVVRKSYQPGASGRLRVPLTLFLERVVIERLHERAIREDKNLEAQVEEILEREAGG
jgi:hypothetical protein